MEGEQLGIKAAATSAGSSAGTCHGVIDVGRCAGASVPQNLEGSRERGGEGCSEALWSQAALQAHISIRLHKVKQLKQQSAY